MTDWADEKADSLFFAGTGPHDGVAQALRDVKAEEREACAKIAADRTEYWKKMSTPASQGNVVAAAHEFEAHVISKAIREQSND